MSDQPSLDNKAIAETAKAVQEVSKTVARGLDLSEKAAAFIGTVVGPPVDAVGGVLGMINDQIRFWKAQNLNRLAEKYWADIKQRDLSPEQLKALPFGEAYRALEAAALEEDDDIQRLWASLLSNAVDPRLEIKIQKALLKFFDLKGRWKPAPCSSYGNVIDLYSERGNDLLRTRSESTSRSRRLDCKILGSSS